ncbi:hypothetical protein D3C73_678660 [compost metagenome]
MVGSRNHGAVAANIGERGFQIMPHARNPAFALLIQFASFFFCSLQCKGQRGQLPDDFPKESIRQLELISGKGAAAPIAPQRFVIVALCQLLQPGQHINNRLRQAPQIEGKRSHAHSQEAPDLKLHEPEPLQPWNQITQKKKKNKQYEPDGNSTYEQRQQKEQQPQANTKNPFHACPAGTGSGINL